MSRDVILVADQDEAVCKWVYGKIGGVPDIDGYVGHGYVDIDTKELVAGIVYENFLGKGMSSELSVAALDKCNWWDDQTRFEMAYMAFEVQKVDIFRCKIAESNKACISLAERYGFEFKHRIVKGYTDGDLLLYEITKKQAQQHLDKFEPHWFNREIKEEELLAYG